MKIGLVLPALPAYSETFFRNKILGLQQQGHHVVLFVFHGQNGQNDLDSLVIKAPNLSGNKTKVTWVLLQQFFLAIINFKKSLKLFQLNHSDGLSSINNLKQIIANQFLLHHQLDWLHFGFGTMALGRENVAEAIGAKMAISFRGFDIAIYPLKYPGCYERVWKKVSKIHVLSDDLEHLVIQQGGENLRNKCVKITPAIATDFFSRSTPIESLHDPLQLLTIARLHWKKGLDFTLEALELLHQKGIAFRYTIIGTGPEEERLRFTAHQLGISDLITFAGKQSPESIKQHLELTDVYLQYSIQEGFGNAVLEAQAMGVYCIVSDAEGLSENVIAGLTGSVVEKRRPAALAHEIYNYSQLSKQEIAKRSQQAIERVKQNFSIVQQQTYFTRFYHD